MTLYLPLWDTSLDEAAKFGALVRLRRKAQKLKLGQVADAIGIEPKHLGRVERGERKPSFELIVKLSSFIGVSPAAFFDFDELDVTQKQVKTTIRQLVEKKENPEDLRHILRVLRAMLE